LPDCFPADASVELTKSTTSPGCQRRFCKPVELRETWLNPAEWVDWVITPEEEKAGFPKRPTTKSAAAC
jgi:hypothetical protein